MATYEDVSTPIIAVVGVIGAILVVVIIVLLMVVFYHVEASQQYEKDISQPMVEVGQLAAGQEERLASYGWVDQEKQTTFIPIGRAMDLVVTELSHGSESPESGVSPDDTKEDEDGP